MRIALRPDDRSSRNPKDGSDWTVSDSAKHYGVERWSDGFFGVSESGTVVVRPDRDVHNEADLNELVDQLVATGIELPVLVRFNGILRSRLREIDECFGRAIAETGYRNRYRCVFPIKVNQQRDVVREVVEESHRLQFGVEAGSKPELLAAMAMVGDRNVPIICNGFKDAAYVRLASLAHRLGYFILPVIESSVELDRILAMAKEWKIRPMLGMRVKLAARCNGRWQASGGYRSKFGLMVAELIEQFDRLQAIGMGDRLQLLHFHLGSQIGDVRQWSAAMLEASRIYVELVKRGAGLKYLDVGGGLGVDYDGSRSDSSSSMNYTMQEYANEVVSNVQAVCDETGVRHPELMSESGRAVAAYHGVLVMEAVGVTRQGGSDVLQGNLQTSTLPGDLESSGWPATHMNVISETRSPDQPIDQLRRQSRHIGDDDVMETLRVAQSSLDECMALFRSGGLTLLERVEAEELYFGICRRVLARIPDSQPMPPALTELNRMLSDIYFMNFSLFQSMPDSWAIDQLFPIMPIQRLDERPTQHAVIGDITCDSDGKVDAFVSGIETDPLNSHRPACRETLRLHRLLPGRPYRIAAFMVGAYQEILGDLHNLFGDTHAVHVEVTDGVTEIRNVIRGDTISEVLGYVQYEEDDLAASIEDVIGSALAQGRINRDEAFTASAEFQRALAGYTYLKDLT